MNIIFKPILSNNIIINDNCIPKITKITKIAKKICVSNSFAFAILDDGTVTTYGSEYYGGKLGLFYDRNSRLKTNYKFLLDSNIRMYAYSF